MNNLIKNFKKNGVVEIKNFFNDNEINLLSKRAEEIMSNNFEFLYLINDKKINNSFLRKSKFNSIRNEILESCKGKELKLKTLNNFIDFFQPILKKYHLKDYIFEELHTIFCEHFGFPEDLFYDNAFSSIFFTDKVLDVYRELLESNNLIYYGESTCGYNKPACTFKDSSKLVHQGWHSDDPLNYAKNTSEKTYMLRGSVFYHSDDKKSGGTKFLPGSHYFISPTKLCKKIIKKVLFNKKFQNSIFNTRILFSKNYFPAKKDFILWDKRIMHSPWGVKIRKFPKLSLNPSMEKYFYTGSFPRNLAEENPFPRSLTNLDLGSKSESLDLYIEYISKRDDYKNYWKTKSKLLSKNFISKLASKNVSFNDLCIKKYQNSYHQI